MTTRPVAFFDVDETLISGKSMLLFRDWWDALHPRGERPCALEGKDRSELNRAYYRRFAGVPAAELQSAGREWYGAYRSDPQAFVLPAVTALRRHRALGHLTVLVSGSLWAVLAPLAADLGADRILCASQRVGDDGRLTGEIVRPVIGPVKAEAAAVLMASAGASPEDCFAYGDHESDLPLLRSVGTPAVVGDDPVLTQHALREGWLRLPTETGALPLAAVG
ncbi:HAD family hydrolase [Streptomyces roseoverticillatus]|uniref:HAD family hydrolase n=1 Tax=Streptomyces roseoverticillatus TaxID=66429 RepID=UPI0004C26C36|nr:HAD-IB family hydrolase [Streptomyces roseoverticillatus]